MAAACVGKLAEDLLLFWQAYPLAACVVILAALAAASRLSPSPGLKEEKARPPKKREAPVIQDVQRRRSPTCAGSARRGAPAGEGGCLTGLSCCFGRPKTSPACLGAASGKGAAPSGKGSGKFGSDTGAQDYATIFGRVEESAEQLLEAVLPKSVDRRTVLAKLGQLKSRVADLPASGWLRPDDHRVLLRFLRARQCDVDKAETMLRETHAWRAEVGADKALTEWDREAFRATDPYWKPFGLMGHDRDGDPVLIERLGMADVGALAQMGEAKLQRHEIYTNERVMAVLERERLSHLSRGRHGGFQFTVIEDLHGLNKDHGSARGMALYNKLVRIDEDRYPEIVKRVLIVRAPWIFQLIWKVARHFFDEGTREKITIVADEDLQAAISKFIPMSEVPAMYGGGVAVEGDPDCSEVIAGGKIPLDILERHFQH